MNYEDLFKETACVRIKKGTGRTLKAGGAWIYDNEIDAISGDLSFGTWLYQYKIQTDRTHVIPQKRYCSQ